jgi:hypothetical protein
MSDDSQPQQDLKKQLAIEQRESDFRWLMSDARGRRFMWSTLGACGLFRTSFNHLPGQTEFNEGQRNAGLLLLGRINTLCPEQYGVMAAENAPTPTAPSNDQETDE